MVEFYVEPNTTTIPLGRQGENLARTIYFELSELISNYGEGTATLVYLRSKDSAPYVCDTTQSGIMLSWTPTSTDTAYAGSGKCELRWVVGDVLAKSIVYNTSIAPSIMQAGQIPDPYLSWYDAMMDYIKNNYSESGAPQEVREAIYTLLSKAAYIETGLEDELATVQAWAAEHFTITNNLTNVTTNNNTGIVVSGSSYTATLTASSGYALGTVTVTMGREDVTSTFYSDGVITIAEVTGDVVVTASGVAAVVSLSAVYTQSGTVYDTAALADLKSDLVVTATYGDSSTAVIPGTDYTLSGTLAAGTSTITVSYGGKTATFNVIVTERTTPSDVLYSLPSATTFNGTSTYIDTGLQLMKSEKSDITIVFDAIDNHPVDGQSGGQSAVILHCMHENDPYPGICIQEWDDSGRLYAFDANSNTSSGNIRLSTNSTNIGVRVKAVMIIDFTSKTTKVIANIGGTDYTNSAQLPSDVNDVNISENALLGCYQDTSGTKGRYWKGTVYDFKIYNRKFTDSEAQLYLQEDHS